MIYTMMNNRDWLMIDYNDNDHESESVYYETLRRFEAYSRSKAAEQLLHTISHYKPPQSETFFLTFNMFQPTRGKSKAKKSCEELLLTTCRMKSWYSLVNSGSWIKGDWSLGRWFGKWWWRFCKIVAGSLDWTTGFWSGPATRGDPCTSRTMWSAKLNSSGS